MHLQALTIGEAVPPRAFEGVVHSVFERAVNLRLAVSGSLVTLYAARSGGLPQGIRLLAGPGFSTRACQVGQGVYRAGQRLHLPAAGWTVELGAARLWRCQWPAQGLDPDLPGVLAARLAVSEQVLAAQAAAGHGVYAARLQARLDDLAAAARALDECALPRAAAALAGLGPGLTPSGDDLLLGFAAALRACAGQDQHRLSFLACFNLALHAAAGCTGEISRTYLLHAAQGRFASSLMRLLRAIGRAEQGDPLRQAAQAVLRSGHTSGCDTAAGLLAGLAAWSRFP